MNMVDMKNRWIYKGSMTTPPCKKSVYWNVLHTVYPIKKQYVELLQAKRDGNAEVPKGNWRVTQELVEDRHQVAVVTETTLGSEKDSANDINYNINVNIYNQNVGGQCSS